MKCPECKSKIILNGKTIDTTPKLHWVYCTKCNWRDLIWETQIKKVNKECRNERKRIK